MNLQSIDLVTFIVFIIVVVTVSLYAGRKEENSEDYFLAGRDAGWIAIGASILSFNNLTKFETVISSGASAKKCLAGLYHL